MGATVTATVAGVTVKQTTSGDWYSIKTEGEGVFQTKKRDLATSAKELIGQRAEIEFIEKTSDRINEHTGRPYVNRYLDGILPAGRVATTAGFDIEPSGGDPQRELKIMRQAAAKVAVQLLNHLPENERGPASLLIMSDYLVDYFVNGSPPSAPVAAPTVPFTSDDDIPF